MSAYGGPNVVDDGLVLALDAANIKSFRGEPTTNLLDTNLVNWTKNNNSTVTLLSETYNGNPVYRVTFPAGTLPRIYTTFSYSTGQTFTGSIYYRFVSGQYSGEQLPFFFFREIGFGTNHAITSFTVTENFTPITLTKTFSSTGTSMFLLYRSSSSTSTEVVMDFAMPQLEQKAYATPFVNGTRGTTVATGGGWADRSGNSNHGELLNGPTFDSANGGSIVFDGTDDEVRLDGVGISSWSNPFTMEVWMYVPTGAVWANSYRSTIFATVGAYNGMYGLAKLSTEGEAQFFVRGDNGVIGSTVTGLARDTWHNLVGVWTGSVAYLYYNGILSSGPDGSARTGVPDTTTLTLGLARAFSGATGIYYEGRISNARYYLKALSASEILQNYNATRERFGL